MGSVSKWPVDSSPALMFDFLSIFSRLWAAGLLGSYGYEETHCTSLNLCICLTGKNG